MDGLSSELSYRRTRSPPVLQHASSTSTLHLKPPRNPHLMQQRPSSSAKLQLRGKKHSSRDIYEWQVKTANYEAMMQHFQLRKVNTTPAHSFATKKSLIIDKASSSNRKRWSRFSLRRYVVTKWRSLRRAWHENRKSMTKPMTPEGSWFLRFHGVLMLVTFNFQLFYLPFSPTYYPHGTAGTTAINITLECLFLLDLVVNFNTAYVNEKNVLITNRKQIALRYLRRWFVVDLISSLPVHLVRYVVTGSHAQTTVLCQLFDYIARVPRLMHLRILIHGILFGRVFRTGKHVLTWLLYSRYSHLMAIAQLLWLVLMTSHYMACFWHMLSPKTSLDPHQNDGHIDFAGMSVMEQYVADFYYAVCLIQGQGNVTGGTLEQNAFSTIAVLVGSVILAIVFGNVAMLVSNFNASTTNYQRKMESVFATMSKMHLPRDLRDRIHQYYTHLWQEYESLDGDIVKFSRELTHTLALEVGLFKYMNLVMDIPFWKDCSPDFVTQIVLSLVVRVYLPDDYVIRKGEIGDELYMINRGICEVSDGQKFHQSSPVEAVSTASNALDLGDRYTSTAASSGSIVPDPAYDDDEDEEDDDDDDRRTLGPTSKFGSFSSTGENDEHPDDEMQQSSRVVVPHSARGSNTSKKRLKRAGVIQLFPGQAFGEMSLLMNYKRTANVRAATYVEMCVLLRRDFQTLLCRYAEDRKKVLTHMLQSCIEKKEIPFPWEQICDVVALRRRDLSISSGGQVTTEELVAPLTSSEAAQALVERINVDLMDESIKYGFQGFDKPLEDQLPPTAFKKRVPEPRSSLSSTKPVNETQAPPQLPQKPLIRRSTAPPDEKQLPSTLSPANSLPMLLSNRCPTPSKAPMTRRYSTSAIESPHNASIPLPVLSSLETESRLCMLEQQHDKMLNMMQTLCQSVGRMEQEMQRWRLTASSSSSSPSSNAGSVQRYTSLIRSARPPYERNDSDSSVRGPLSSAPTSEHVTETADFHTSSTIDNTGLESSSSSMTETTSTTGSSTRDSNRRMNPTVIHEKQRLGVPDDRIKPTDPSSSSFIRPLIKPKPTPVRRTASLMSGYGRRPQLAPLLPPPLLSETLPDNGPTAAQHHGTMAASTNAAASSSSASSTGSSVFTRFFVRIPLRRHRSIPSRRFSITAYDMAQVPSSDAFSHVEQQVTHAAATPVSHLT